MDESFNYLVRAIRRYNKEIYAATAPGGGQQPAQIKEKTDDAGGCCGAKCSVM